MLPLSTVINISVSLAPGGLKNYNINNVALFTTDTPIIGLTGDYGIYVSPAAVATQWGSTSETYLQAQAIFSQNPNLRSGNGSLIIIPFVSGDAQSISTAVARVYGEIFFCGILSTTYPAKGSMKAIADAIQAYGDKILFLPSYDITLLSAGGTPGDFYAIMSAGDYCTRCLLYNTGDTSGKSARLFAAAYAGRGMSVDFTGSNTAITMNLKQLATITPDETITQAILVSAATAGVDTYIDIEGQPDVWSTGANRYFDEVYNLIWLVSALKVAGYNALATVGTKIPQTEPGMTLLKAAYQAVLDQAVNNGYLAPGIWNSAEWFGDPATMALNIEEKGYYMYSAPVNQQSQANRVARITPLIQIAVKEAGAFHSGNVTVNINP